MPSKTEGRQRAEFIVSEANGSRSRDVVTIITGQNLKAGAVLGKITASGKYTAVNAGAADGSQTAVAVLLDNTDASAADKSAVAILRDAEVIDDLEWAALNAGQITTAKGQLANVGIFVRSAV